MNMKLYDPRQKLAKAEKSAQEAAKVTPSATPSTTSALPTTPEWDEHQPTAEIDPEMPPLEEITTPKKKLRFNAPDSIPQSKHFQK